MSMEENKALVQRIWQELIREGKTERIEELIAPDYAYHAPGGQELRGREGFRELITWIHASFPDFRATLDDVIAEGDRVVTAYTVMGTHKSGRPLSYQGVTISRFANGKEAEAWDFYDMFAMALQLAPGLAKGLLRIVEKQMVRNLPGQSGGRP